MGELLCCWCVAWLVSCCVVGVCWCCSDVLSVDDRTHDNGAGSEMDPLSVIQMLMAEASNSSAFAEKTSTTSSGICQRQALSL